jgi:alpha,alpha-trehalase
MTKFLLVPVIIVISVRLSYAQIYFEKEFGGLFREVQERRVFPDSKTFVDCVPNYPAADIMERYHEQKENPLFNLREFVISNFTVPGKGNESFRGNTSQSVEEHINSLWEMLKRPPDTLKGSLLPLPQEYIVPGGRFREIYYWDSYFTMLGLEVSGRYHLIENMINNFGFLINELGFIPNGNRTYYTGRSQPPFFTSMVNLLASVRGQYTLVKYLSSIEKEYNFWMKGENELTEAVYGATNQNARFRVVKLPDGAVLNRYYDFNASPRPESYLEDEETAGASDLEAEKIFRHLRAGAESGWDFSSRWLRDGETLSTIHTTEIIPVDLNALLYNQEVTLARGYALKGDAEKQAYYQQRAEQRKAALERYCWNNDTGFYTDYDFVAEEQKSSYSLAGLYPLFFRISSGEKAQLVSKYVEENFLQPGGVVSTLVNTGQQWDEPNGWAPLQWITIKGLMNYNQDRLAEKIATAWIDNNRRVYQNTGKIVEKYNVMDITLPAGGGEYDLQDGFGWSNGVLLKLIDEFEQQ